MAKKTLAQRYDDLPKEIKVVPYLVIAGALTELIKYYSSLEVSDPLLMGVVNLVVVVLVQLKSRLGR